MRLLASRFVSSSTVSSEITGVIGLISTPFELMHTACLKRPGRLPMLSEMAPVDGNNQQQPGRSESCACHDRSSTMAAQGRDLG
jgi:hypothetical protein